MSEQAAIHDQTYRRWEGTRRPSWTRWWTITREGIRLALRHRLLLLFVLGPPTIHFLARVIQIYAYHQLQLRLVGPIDARFFQHFLIQQSFSIVLFCVLVGSGLIAHDRRDRTLQFYLSKPIRRFDYVLGKLGVVLAFLLLITLVPGLLLFVVELAFGETGSYLARYYWLPISITGFSLLLVLPPAMFILAMSSLTHNARYAAIGFAAVGIFSPVVAEMLRAIFRSSRFLLFSLWASAEQVSRAMFGLSRTTRMHWGWGLLVLTLLTLASAGILYRQIQGVEVVE